MFQKRNKRATKSEQKQNESDYSPRKRADRTAESLEPFGPSAQCAAAAWVHLLEKRSL